jgi:hypothetical protein
MKERVASCSCGQLVAKVRGDPIRAGICHCFACQRRTGSVFGVQSRFPRAAVTISGESTAYTRVGDSGGGATFHFCPRCGATVYYEAKGLEDQIAIPVGAFADPTFPTPILSVYEERMHPWVRLPDGIEHMD